MAKKKRKKSTGPHAAKQANVPTMAELKVDSRPPENPSTRGGRETVDALVIAIVLAFFIRTFQAEAFVIPTGSMAPTLMGAHKDVFCDQCGQRFRVNASDEGAETIAMLQREVQIGRISHLQAGQELKLRECVGGVCPECRYVMPIRTDDLEPALPPGVEEERESPTYSGDRLVVSKYAYTFADPERWDVIVFKYPGNAVTNYIKRLVGLPNEALRVFQGDLFVKPANASAETPYGIARKPPEKVLAMRQLVHDTDHDALLLYQAGWPLRWEGDGDWKTDVTVVGKNARQTFLCETSGEQTSWLRYRHMPANEAVWRKVLTEREKDQFESSPRPSLITDYTAYNSRILRNNVARFRQFTLRPLDARELGRSGVHWAGDLMLEADLEINSSEGRIALDLVEAGEHYRCTINISTGEAQLTIHPFEGQADDARVLASAATPIRGKGSHEVCLANFDDQLLLWINGEVIEMEGRYDAGATLEERRKRLPQTSQNDPADLAPASIGVESGSLKISRLRVYRDIYYIADRWGRKRAFVHDMDLSALQDVSGKAWDEAMLGLPANPEWWPALRARRHADFSTADDQFFMMGDNSAESLDSRLWYGGNGRDGGRPGGPYLERSQLVGKAICVYWPHAWYSVPFTGRLIPAWPNFADMRLVR